MRAPSRFDALIDELGLAKAIDLDTAEDDARIAAAAGEEGEEGDDGGELHPSDEAVLKTFRKVVEVVSALGREMKEVRAELDDFRGRGGQPMKKALRGPVGPQLDAEAFLAKALSAQAAGRIDGTQVAIAEVHINAGRQPPADIVRAVLG